MSPEEYQEYVLQTCGKLMQRDRFILAAMGIAGEAGEVNDLAKKVLFHDHNWDNSKMREELGDLLWYLVLMCLTCGLDLREVMQANAEKLRMRYPDGFDPEWSKNRNKSE